MMASHIAYSPDGNLIAVAGEGALSILDAESGKERTRIKCSHNEVRCIAFSPNSDRVAVGDVRPVEPVRSPTLSGSPTRSGRNRARPPEFYDVFIRLYDLSDISLATVLECGNPKNITGLAFAADGKRLFAAVDRDVKVWTLEVPVVTSVDETSDNNSTLTYDRRGTHLATIHNDPPRVVVRHAVTGDPVHTLRGSAGKIYDATFDPKNQTIAAACSDNAIVTWDAQSGAPKRKYEAKKSCFRVRFDPTGRFIAAGGWLVTVWDLHTGQVVHEIQEKIWSAGISFSADGQRFAFANRFAGVHVLDTNNWQTIWVHDPGALSMISLAFSPDGRFLVGCGGDRHIWIWNATTGDVVKTLVGPSKAFDVAFCDDGSRFVTGHRGQTVLWDSTTWNQLLRLDVPPDTGGVVTISPDGRHIAAGGRRIFIW
jgi:WD40 repeat protein